MIGPLFLTMPKLVCNCEPVWCRAKFLLKTLWLDNYYIIPSGCLSLGTLVPNSRDRHEKQWRPDFTRHKTHPKIRFV